MHKRGKYFENDDTIENTVVDEGDLGNCWKKIGLLKNFPTWAISIAASSLFLAKEVVYQVFFSFLGFEHCSSKSGLTPHFEIMHRSIN